MAGCLENFFRLLSVGYCIMFVIYFSFRLFYSLGDTHLLWRFLVLLVEFLATISVLFVVILRLKQPWDPEIENRSSEDWKEFASEYYDTGKTKKQDFTPTGTPTLNKDVDSKQEHSKMKLALVPYQSPRAVAVDLDTPVTSPSKSPSLQASSISSVASEEPAEPGVKSAYTVHILIPCYKEDVSIVRKTAHAAFHIKHPPEKLFVYILDDGGDKEKESFVKHMHHEFKSTNIKYICRPRKHKGHGKAGNLNHALQRRIYRNAKRVSSKDLVIIFDADMVASPNFLIRLIPYFEENRRVVMVQTPQTFHNVPLGADFFDAHNINFFNFMLPAMDAWNTTTCCGTNFIVSAKALSKAGWFPLNSVTEDFYLAMKLLSDGGIIRYHSEHLAVGEAPEDMRQLFQQRSRWAKGTVQIAISDNPLTNKGLTWIQRLAFFNACWSYMTSAFMNPLFILFNAAAIVFGLFPVTEIDFFTAGLFVSYYSLFYTMIHFTPKPKTTYVPLWVVGKMGHFFSFMAFKAIYNVAFRTKQVDFKVTKKTILDHEGATTARDSTRHDILYHGFVCLFIVTVFTYGFHLVIGGTPLFSDLDTERSNVQKSGIRVFCMTWMLQFLIAYSLPLWYAALPHSFSLQSSVLKALCAIDSVLSITLIIVTILMFRAPWMNPLPKIKAITDFGPSETPFWVSDAISLRGIAPYVERSARDGSIPVVVVRQRSVVPTVDANFEGMLSSSVSMREYDSRLSEVASKITEVDFPSVVILEPAWMIEEFPVDFVIPKNKEPVEEPDEDPLPDEDPFPDEEPSPVEGSPQVEEPSPVEDSLPVEDPSPVEDPPQVGEPSPDEDPLPVEDPPQVEDPPLVEESPQAEEPLVEEEAFLDDAASVEVFTLDEDDDMAVSYDARKVAAMLDTWIAFAERMHPLSYVYVDVGHPLYLSSVNYAPVELIASYTRSSRIRGVAINVANFFNSSDNVETGAAIYENYGLHFVEDTSRNGGNFTTQGAWESISACQNDPPNIAAGAAPEWSWRDVDTTGQDAALWVKIAGEADGRMYPEGEFHKCLMRHNNSCSERCPQDPVTYKKSCMCD